MSFVSLGLSHVWPMPGGCMLRQKAEGPSIPIQVTPYFLSAHKNCVAPENPRQGKFPHLRRLATFRLLRRVLGEPISQPYTSQCPQFVARHALVPA